MAFLRDTSAPPDLTSQVDFLNGISMPKA